MELEVIKKLIKKYNISLISVGNGTASRESEQVIVELLKEIPEKVKNIVSTVTNAITIQPMAFNMARCPLYKNRASCHLTF